MHGLVVENDAVSRDQLVHALDELHFRVQVAGSSDTALDMLSSNRFDLTVLDIGVPGLVSGRELARRISPRIGTIVIGERRFEEEFTGEPVVSPLYYLTKPVDDRLFHSCLQAVREQTRLRREVRRLQREVLRLRKARAPEEGEHVVDDLWFGIFNRIQGFPFRD
jgi:DNA-binding response OmpR family regulator